MGAKTGQKRSQKPSSEPTRFSLRLAGKDDSHLDEFDYSKMAALSMCPTWGIVRYGMYKVMRNQDRAMALEAGQACHDVFASVRLLDSVEHRVITPEQFIFHGHRLFGVERFGHAYGVYEGLAKEDDRTRRLGFGLDVLDTSGFYDSPFDRRRTVANLEEACIHYIDRWNWGCNPVWVRGPEPEDDIGVEIAFNYVIEHNIPDVPSFRFVGRMDGLHIRKRIRLGENKTASRLDEAWSESFRLSHQVTGYLVAANEFVNAGRDDPVFVSDADIIGLAIPQPMAMDHTGLTTEKVTRTPEHFAHWVRWVAFVVQMYYSHKDDVVNAPKFTHSCNRFFRPCSMIPFCDSPDDEKAQILEDMPIDRWSPLDDKATD